MNHGLYPFSANQTHPAPWPIILRRKPVKKVLTITSALAATLALTNMGCDKSAAKEIKIGVIHSQTGMYAAFGQGGVFGIKAAVEDINKLGGVKVGDTRIPIKVVVVDDESDANKSGALAESLINQDKVQFIVAGVEPSNMLAGPGQMADRYKVPYVTSSGPMEPWLGMRNESMTKWQYTWCTGSFSIMTPAKDGEFRAKPGYTAMDTWFFMLKNYGGSTNKKVGVICSDEPDGRGWYSCFVPAIKNFGYEVAGAEKQLGLIPMETTDFTSVIKAWQDAKVEILWGNCPGPFFATVWKQAKAMGFNPKIVSIGRAALYYDDVKAYGADLPWGVGTEIWWDQTIKNSPGFGTTTPQSLADRWAAATKQPLNPAIGPGYADVQVLVNAIERAGSVDPEKVNAALATTDMQTMRHRVKFDENHFSRGPLVFGQWFKTDKPEKWELKVTSSSHDFWPATDKFIYPVPSK